jgi:outer membrane receptor protein involved in Fe transport
MKHLYCRICIFFLSHVIFGAKAISQDSRLSIGHFYGRIIDAKTNKGIEGVSVQLIQIRSDTAAKKTREIPVSGMITGKNGDFSLENLPIMGDFRLRLTGMSYKYFEQKVDFGLRPGKAGTIQIGNMQQIMAAAEKDLGNIKLEVDVHTLEQVTVSAREPLMQLSLDKKTFNVEKDISASGGTALDVMKHIPGIAVDIDGNIRLRNSTPVIYVDGLPTTLTLEQIPADAIQSVEIITNPGAKFDASNGSSGILNVVMKKNRKPGYNGNLRGGIDSHGQFNLGGDANIKEGKINLFTSANYSERKSISTGITNRYTFLASPNDSLRQDDKSVNWGNFVFVRGGLDYFMDNRNTLSVSGILLSSHFTPYQNSNLYIDTLYHSGTATSYTYRMANTNGHFYNHGAMFSYKHNFPKAGKALTVNVNYSSGRNESSDLVSSFIHEMKYGPISYTYSQLQTNSTGNEFGTAQADFTTPVSDKSTFESGVRAAVRNENSANDYESIQPGGSLVPLTLLSSQYIYHDRVFAGYLTYSNAIRNFSYQVGLRAENSNYTGNISYTIPEPGGALNDTVGNFNNQIPISLFPSIFFRQRLGRTQNLQLSYSRYIDRPNYFQLFPFTDYSDSLNVTRGNPNLRPQFTHSFELSYQINYAANNSFIGSLYYKYKTDLITFFVTKGTNPYTNSPVFVNTYINANFGYIGGLELIGRNSVARWWDITSNINIYNSMISVSDSVMQPTGQLYSMFIKINNLIRLPRQFTLQVAGDYTSKTVLPPTGSGNSSGTRNFGGTVSGNAQGYSKPTGGIDASIRYEFMKNRAMSLTLSVADLFRTRRSDIYTQSSYFIQETLRRRDPQFFRLQVNYHFGKVDASLLKRGNNKMDVNDM